MPLGQFYPGTKLNRAPIFTDSPITANAGWATNTPAVITPAVPGSATAATNVTGTNCYVYVIAGTVQAVTINGATVSTTTKQMFFVPARSSIAVTYTVAPTWYWQAV